MSIALVPAWLPRNWHLGDERPIADGGTWLCWGWASGAKREGNGNQHEGGSHGWAMANIKHIGGAAEWAMRKMRTVRSVCFGNLRLKWWCFYVHQYHQRGVDEAYKRAGENVVIADNGQTGMRINSTIWKSFACYDPPRRRKPFCYFTPLAIDYDRKVIAMLWIISWILALNQKLICQPAVLMGNLSSIFKTVLLIFKIFLMQ